VIKKRFKLTLRINTSKSVFSFILCKSGYGLTRIRREEILKEVRWKGETDKLEISKFKKETHFDYGQGREVISLLSYFGR